MGAANPAPARRAVLKPSLQLCVLRLGFLQDGNVGVSVFPERKEVLIGALLLWLCRCSWRRPCQVEDARAQPTENSARYRDGPETFRTQSLPLDLDVQADKFDRADKLDTEFPLASVVARPVRREQLLPKISEPGLNCRR